MPSIISHPAVPLAIGAGLGSGIIPRRLLLAGVLCAILPDLDVYARLLTSAISHRGVTHSLFFALVCAGAAASIAPALDSRRLIAFAFILLVTASHGLLDAFTTGGSGIAFFWPFTDERYFMPIRVIEVSPLGISRFFSERGIEVLASELEWVWPPAIVLGIALYGLRRALRARNRAGRP